MKKILFFASAVAVLAGCSKELTEEATPAPVTGKSTIYATYNGGLDATRTYAEPDGNSYQIQWDAGDAFGVFNSVAGDESNSLFAYTGEYTDEKVGIFKGDLTLLDSEYYVAYYPYDANTVLEGKNLTINIPRKQNYREVEGSDKGSFASNVAPAVAYGKATADRLDMEFYPLATYVRVPIKGIGTVEKLELSFGEEVKLAGKITVDIDKIAEGKYIKGGAVVPTNECEWESITLNCLKGKKGVDLKQDEETYFWFVIPAGIDMASKIMKITINDGQGILTRKFPETQGATPLNTPIVIGQDVDENKKAVPFNWIVGAEKMMLIENAYDFVKYVYVATEGPTENTPKDMFTADDKLKSAMIIRPINMAEFQPSDKHSDYTGENAKYTSFESEVYYDWYVDANKKAITTIGGAMEYTIIGNVPGSTTAVIEGLNVKGDGVFVATYAEGVNVGTNNKVKNITLKDVTVTTETTGRAYLVADNLWAFGEDGDGLDNIVLEGCTLKAENAESTALLNIMQSGWIEKFPIKYGEELPATVKYVANELDVFTNKAVTFTEDYFTEEGILFGAVVPQRNNPTTCTQGAILTVPTLANANALIAAIKTDKNDYPNAGDGTGWFSVIAKKWDYNYEDVSVYTGLKPTPNDKTNVDEQEKTAVTAESLVWHINNTSTGNDFKLTNHISFEKAVVPAPTYVYSNFKLDGDNYKIFRVTIDGKTGLFGPRVKDYSGNNLLVNVKNLEVASVTVNITEGQEAFLLAKSGTAENVKASSVSFKGTGAKDDLVAGLFYEANINDAVKTTDCKVIVTAAPEGAKFGAIYGKLDVCLGHTYKFEDTTFGKDAFATLNCYMDAEDGVHDNNTFIVFAGNKAPDAEKVVEWNTEKGAIGPKHIVFFQNPQQAEKPEGMSSKIYDGSLSDQKSFENALKDATAGQTIKVAAGTYQFPDIKDIAENVTIECAPGTIIESFNSGLSYRLNKPNGHTYGTKGLKIVGATFKTVGEYAAIEGYIYNQTFENCIFDFGNITGYGLYPVGGTTTFKNCQFKGERALNVQPAELQHNEKKAKFVFDDCSFEGWVVAWGNSNGCMTYEFKNACSLSDGGWFAGSTNFDGCTFAIDEVVQKESTESAGNKGIILDPKENDAKYIFKGCTNAGLSLDKCIVKYDNANVVVE